LYDVSIFIPHYFCSVFKQPITVKPIFFLCSLFHDLENVGNIQKFHAILVYYLVQQAKMPKLNAKK